MYMSPLQNSRSSFFGLRRPMRQEMMVSPQPALPPFMQSQMAFQRSSIPDRPQFLQKQTSQIQGSSEPRQHRLEEVLSLQRPSQSHRAGNNMPLPSFMQPKNTTDPTQIGGEKPTGLGTALQINQTMPTLDQAQPAPEQALRDQRSVEMQEMQSMMREMMQMISALSNRGGFGGGYGGGFSGGYSPRQQMMFGGIGSIPMSRGMFY